MDPNRLSQTVVVDFNIERQYVLYYAFFYSKIAKITTDIFSKKAHKFA